MALISPVSTSIKMAVPRIAMLFCNTFKSDCCATSCKLMSMVEIISQPFSASSFSSLLIGTYTPPETLWVN